MYYLSTETIENAYKTLTSLELSDSAANAMFYFFIMKACGINRISYESPNFSEKNGLYYASRLSSLFTPSENQPKKYGFLNPFTMKSWPTQPISEPLKNWIGSRLKNNVCGGGMQWRNFIDMDTKDSEITIKFKYKYIEWLKDSSLESKTINLFAIAIWANRFTCFKEKVTSKELIDEFLQTYKIETEEKSVLFNTNQDYDLEYSNHIYDAAHIRELIGAAPDNEWDYTKLTNKNLVTNPIESYSFNTKSITNQKISLQLIKNILQTTHQAILAGPPGTSKSFYANQIAKDYDEVFHIQFHPQYTYQQFVGGYIVDGTNVKGLKSHRNGITMQIILDSLQKIGYHLHWSILNSHDFGIPQKRERWYCVGFDKDIEFEFPKGTDNKTTLRDIVDIELDDPKLKLSDFEMDRIKHHFNSTDIRVKHDNSKYAPNTKKGKYGIYSYLKPDKTLRFHIGDTAKTQIQEAYYCSLDSVAPAIIVAREPKLWDLGRRLSVDECRKLQGYPDGFILDDSEIQAKKQMGNGVAVPVIEAIALSMLIAYTKNTPKKNKKSPYQMELGLS